MKILVVEDDANISTLLCTVLNRNGYACDTAFSGTEAQLRLQMGTYALMICDLNLPGISGEELIDRTRKTSSLPILVLTAKGDIEDKIHVLGLGADDYMTKPFDNRELIARIAAHLRRSDMKQESEVLKFADLEMYPMEQKLLVNGNPVNLTVHEFEILKTLMENPKKVFSKENMYQIVWKNDYYGEDNTVSVHVSNLRKKLSAYSQKEYIQTVWGIGFRMNGEL